MTLTTVNWTTGFVRLQGPAEQSQTAGIVLTITNATAALSNGLLTVTAGIASNSLNQISTMNTNLPIQLNLVGQ